MNVELYRRRLSPLRAGALLSLVLDCLQKTLSLGLRRRMVSTAADGVLQIAPDDRNALDEFREALHQEQGKPERYQQFRRIHWQTTRVESQK